MLIICQSGAEKEMTKASVRSLLCGGELVEQRVAVLFLPVEVPGRRLAVDASAPTSQVCARTLLVGRPFDIVCFGLVSVRPGLEPVSLHRFRRELAVGEDELVVERLCALVG